MLQNSDFCVYGGNDEEVYGVEENPDYNLSEEYDYYRDPQLSSFSGNYVSDSEEDAYSYETYYYHYGPVYYYQPVFLMYYPVFPVQYYTYNAYYPIYESIPVYNEYYVPNYDNSTVVSTCDDQVRFYESPPVSSVGENPFTCEGLENDLYNTENRLLNDMSNICEQELDEGITTNHFSYEEYAEKLNDAPADVKGKSVVFDKKLDEATASYGSHVNGSAALNQINERVYSTDICPYEEDVDEKVIKKISLLDIDEIKEEDDKYEDGKMFLYNQVLKGFIVNQNQLEELVWECHILEDILEDDETESDLPEMDFNENFEKELMNVGLKSDSKNNDLPDVRNQSPFASSTLSDALQVTSSVVPRDATKVSSENGKGKSKDFSPNESEEIVDGGSVIRVGEVEIRYTPDRYRYFCLQESRKKRLKPIRKFFARIWRYVKKPT